MIGELGAAMVVPDDQISASIVSELHLDQLMDSVLATPSDLAFVSGSRVEGLGNPTSDIDAFIVTTEPKHFSTAWLVSLGRYNIDFELLEKSELLQLAENFNGISQINYSDVTRIPLSNIDLYYRTAIGRGVYNIEAFQTLQNHFDVETSRIVYGLWAKAAAQQTLQRANAFFSVDEARAGNLIEESLAWALEFYCAERGQGYPNPKWRFEKLQRITSIDSDVYTQAWRLKGQGELGAQAYFAAASAFVRQLGIDVGSPSSDGDTILGNLSVRIVAAPDVLRLGEENYIVNEKRMLRLSEVGLSILESLQSGIVPSQLQAYVRREHDVLISEDEIVYVLELLASVGVLEHSDGTPNSGPWRVL
ncbi:MAG: hypothetical protein F4X20_04245 [Dehalococcoidia bacterium]|nr:hypothetical protein [Dehalococcoidia bacterium]